VPLVQPAPAENDAGVRRDFEVLTFDDAENQEGDGQHRADDRPKKRARGRGSEFLAGIHDPHDPPQSLGFAVAHGTLPLLLDSQQ